MDNRREGFVNIVEKLDRFFIAGDWATSGRVCEIEILPITGLDHYPITLTIQDEALRDVISNLK